MAAAEAATESSNFQRHTGKGPSRDNKVEMAESLETSQCSPSDRPPLARTSLLNPKAPRRDKYSNAQTIGTAHSSYHRE